MASIEDTLRLVGFPRQLEGIDGIDVAKDLESFQRAEHNVERMETLRKGIMELIKRRFRFDSYAGKIVRRDLKVNGEVIAEVQGERRFGKTAYKAIVDGMEAYLLGMAFHTGNGGVLPNVSAESGSPYVHAQTMYDNFQIVLGGNLKPAVEYNVIPANKLQPLENSLAVPVDAARKLSANSIALLAHIDLALPAEKDFMKSYKKASAAGAPKGGPRVTVAGRTSVEGTSTEREQVDYTDVVRTLIDVPMSHHERHWDPELPYVISEEFSLDELRELMPWYDLTQRDRSSKRMESGIYVGVQSVYDRMQELKEEGFRTVKIPTTKVKRTF